MKTNVLLIGPIGTGKTKSIETLVPHKETFMLTMEAGLDATVGLSCKDGFHSHYIACAKTDWDTLARSAEKLNQFQMKQLSEMPASDKRDYAQFLEIYSTCASFKCDKCRETFGAVDKWDDSRAFVIDSLTPLSRMAKQFVVGSKPITTQPEWGAAMDLIENLMWKLTGDTKCTFVLLSHSEREPNLVTGGSVITVSTLGQKLAPKIPKLFDEVILTRHEGTKFYWSTDDTSVDLKARRLPYSDSLAPDFGQLFKDEINNGDKKGKRAA